jgi:hypothetical protein
VIHEAIETVEAVIWGAVISVGLLTAGAAYLIVALGYWTAVLATWTSRTITHHLHARKEKP